MLHAARWKCTMQNNAKNSLSGHHRATLSGLFSQLRHLLTIGKKVLNSNISFTCPHNMANVGLLTAEICWRVWGTPANFKGFCVLASLLQRCRSTEVNQTLHDVWPSPGLAHDIYIFRGSCPVTEFCHVQNSLCVQLLRSPILAALLHDTRAKGVSERLRRRTRTTDLSQRASPIFGWAAITLRIGSHSSHIRTLKVLLQTSRLQRL